jgi:hypothetical protein
VQVTGEGERLPKQGAGFVVGPARGVVRAQHPGEGARLLDEERKLLTHAIAMAAYTAESTAAGGGGGVEPDLASGRTWCSGQPVSPIPNPAATAAAEAISVATS